MANSSEVYPKNDVNTKEKITEQTKHGQRLKQHALLYAKLGLPVIRATHQGKKPYPAVKGVFYQQITTDEQTIHGWDFDADKGLNLKVIPDGTFIIFDVDWKNGGQGDKGFEKLRRDYNLSDLTLVAESGSGEGAHYYYRLPGGWTGKKFFDDLDPIGYPGVEVKFSRTDPTQAVGQLHGLRVCGSVVAPPSIHPDTQQAYKWRFGCAPADYVGGSSAGLALRFPTLPKSLCRDMCPAAPPRNAPLIDPDEDPAYYVPSTYDGLLDRICTKIETSDSGSRNKTFYVQACRAWEVIPKDDTTRDADIEKRLRAAGSAAGMSLSEVQSTLASAQVKKGRKQLPEMDPLPLNDFGMAQRVKRRYGRHLRWTEGFGFSVYDGRCWKLVSNTAMLRYTKPVCDTVYFAKEMLYDTFAEDYVNKRASKLQEVKEQKSVITALTALLDPLPPEEMEQPAELLNVLNGTVDLCTGKLGPHDPEDGFNHFAHVEYIPGATAPRWEQFIREIMSENDELVAFIQRVLGYALFGHNKERKVVIFTGDGKNGKSVLVSTLSKVLGSPLVAVMDPKLLTGQASQEQGPSTAELFGSRLALVSEIPEGARAQEDQLKRLTGGDPLRARYRYKGAFSFIPQFLPVVATNDLPILSRFDQATKDRLLVVPFDRRFDGDSCDPRLGETLYSERQGILKWLVDGAAAWHAHGLQEPQIIHDTAEEYIDTYDWVREFVEKHCRPALEVYNAEKQRLEPARVLSSELYETYRSWCEKEGRQPMNHRRFSQALKKRGLVTCHGMKGTQFEHLAFKGEVTYGLAPGATVFSSFPWEEGKPGEMRTSIPIEWGSGLVPVTPIGGTVPYYIEREQTEIKED